MYSSGLKVFYQLLSVDKAVFIDNFVNYELHEMLIKFPESGSGIYFREMNNKCKVKFIIQYSYSV